MPFQSQKQRSFFWATMPATARKWEDETPRGKLPKYKRGTPKKTRTHKKAETMSASVLPEQLPCQHPLWRQALEKFANGMLPTVNAVTPPPVAQPPLGVAATPTGVIKPPTMAAAQQHPQHVMGGGSGGPTMNPIQSFGALSSTGQVNGNAGMGVAHSTMPKKYARVEGWLGLPR